jgi:butyrate kinase
MKKSARRDLTIAVNPGSTSTKLAIYRGEECLALQTIDHKKEVLARFACVADQFEFRRDAVMRFLSEHGVEGERCEVVAGRGGILKPIPGGVYRINARMLRELRASKWGEHPCNLGAPLAHEIARVTGATAFIVDPPVVDEMWPLARYAGHPAFQRKSRFHALSQRAAARRAARELKTSYKKINLIVVHMGGGITVGVHRRGQVVDVNDGLDGEGPLSPERSGSLPTGMLASLCFSGKFSHDIVKKMLVGHGGLYAYLGTNDCREIECRIRRGDAKARELYEAMAYQIGKWVGASAAVLSGRAKAVVITGGMSKSRLLVSMIRKYAGFVAPFLVYPEMEEMFALAASGQAAAAGTIQVQEYR